MSPRASAMTTRKEVRFEGLGEGRSKPIYIPPRCTDTAVLMAFYNPARFHRSLKNLLYLMSVFKQYGIPCFVVECVFGSQRSQVPEATLVVRSNTYLFYKEQLLNRLEPLVPAKYTKLVMLDGDILFDTPDWLDQVSEALNSYDIIQPFSQACWLNPENTIISSKKHGYGYALNKRLSIRPTEIHNYHSGFAWAFRRDTFQRMGGYYDRAIVGGGDMMFVCSFLPPECIASHQTDMQIPAMIFEGAWPAYKQRVERLNPRIGYLDIKALHLFHGLALNRQYRTRYKNILHRMEGTWDETVELNKDGLYEFKDPEKKGMLLEYFKARKEDIPIKEAVEMMERVRLEAVTRRVERPIQKRRRVATAKAKGTAMARSPPPIEIQGFNLPITPAAFLNRSGLNAGDLPPDSVLANM